MTAVVLGITALENGRPLGAAVLCAPVRYCSILWRGVDRPERRHVPVSLWQHVDRSIADKLEAGPLPTDHPIVVALLPKEKRSGFVLQYMYQLPVNESLDALLMSLAPPSLSIRQEHDEYE